MAKSSDRELSMPDIILFSIVAVWGLAASVLTVLSAPPMEVMVIGLAVGVLTIAAAVIGFVRRAAVWAVVGAGALLSIGMIVAGAITIAPNGFLFLAAGAIGLVLTGCTAAVVVQLARGTSSSAAAPTGKQTIAPGNTMEHLLAQIYENSMLSDTAKRVIFREREIDMLRGAIEHDIAVADYGAALTLCDDIANLFGQRETAEQFRVSIENARREHYEAEIHQAMSRFDNNLADRDWARAHQEAARIRRLYPEAHVLHEIDHKIEAARKLHKDDLEARFLEAAKHEDVEQAMELLKELDRYLSREEADQFKEVAQGVVTKHRDNLGVQFKLAVNDRRWFEAAQIGDTIIREFPNTKMADEVRSLIDVIRTRATQAAVSAQGA